MQFVHLALVSAALAIIGATDTTEVASSSQLLVDVQWVMQGYKFGFQGFFVEFLGISSSIVKYMPMLRLVKSSYLASFTEPPFSNPDKFLDVELFEKESINLKQIMSPYFELGSRNEAIPKSKFMSSAHIADDRCNDIRSISRTSTVVELDTSYTGGELAKYYVPNVSSAVDCCRVCVASSHCIAWTFGEGLMTSSSDGGGSDSHTNVGDDIKSDCRLQGSLSYSKTTNDAAARIRATEVENNLLVGNDSPGSPTPAAARGGGGNSRVQGRVISGRMVKVEAASGNVTAMRYPVPRVLIFHGTTCIHHNQSISAPGRSRRDINTIFIGRYMVERGHMQRGLSLDEYAVMHCAARMDEIWVPTEWHKQVFTRILTQQGSAASVPPITVIPEAVDTSLFDPNYHHHQYHDDDRKGASFTSHQQQPPTKRRSIRPDAVSSFGDMVSSHRCGVNLNLPSSTTTTDAATTEASIQYPAVKCYPEGSKFQFLSIFKWEYRKGWDILLEAYWRAFKPTDDVILRLRTYLPSSSAGDGNITHLIEAHALQVMGQPLAALAPVVWERGLGGLVERAVRLPSQHQHQHQHQQSSVEVLVDGAPSSDTTTSGGAGGGGSDTQTVIVGGRTEIIANSSLDDLSLTREDMRDLLKTADCFVLPTRGEGWGLPIAEAMAMQLPVIVTNYSGPAAYITDENAYLLSVLPDLDDLSFAAPNMTHLMELMRQVVFDSVTTVPSASGPATITPAASASAAAPGVSAGAGAGGGDEGSASIPNIDVSSAGSAAQRKGIAARHTMEVTFSADSIVEKMVERIRYHVNLRGWEA